MSHSQSFDSQILDALCDGILILDQRNVVLYANLAAKQLLGTALRIGVTSNLSFLSIEPDKSEFELQDPFNPRWVDAHTAVIRWKNEQARIVTLRDISARKQAELSLQASETLFRTLAKNAPVGIFRTDAEGRYSYVNQRWSEICGCKALTAHDDGWLDCVHPDDRASVDEQWRYSVSSQIPFNCQYRIQDNGIVRWVIARASAEWNEQELLQGFVGTVTEITELKNNELRLSQAATVLETTREGVMITDTQLRIQMINRAFCEITGYSQSETLGQTPRFLRSDRHSPRFYAQMFAAIKQTGHWQGEIWNRHKDGHIYPELLSISVIRDAEGVISNYIGVFADISKLKASEKELQFLAHHDPLTKLPNRALFLSRLKHCLERAQRQNSNAAVLMLDLDRFKDVNDSFGHLAGDELLKLVADTLSNRLRSSDTICRLGGDEFVILLEDLSQADAAARVAQEIIDALSKVWKLSQNIEARIGVSVGIALYPEHGDTPEELIQQADAALYKAKHEGRNRFKYFSEDLTIAARERMDIEIRLRQAIENNELQVYYQPQIDVASKQIVGAEALVRWQTASGEFVPPSRFIQVAEETGLISAIGNWVLEEVCQQGRLWLDQQLPTLRLAVNLSAQQLLHSNICDIVANALACTGFPADALELELTESALMRHEQEGLTILQRLNDLGVQIAIDDFGTGYSSLAYLKRFPLGVLKIDKSFIDDIPMQQNDMEITSTIIAMAKTLRMRVIAEGVETDAQLDFLKHQECDHYQGYLTCRPLPAKAFATFVRHYQPDNPDYNHRLATQLASETILPFEQPASG